MPTGGRPTLTQFLIEERRRHPDATGDLNALVTDVSLACKAIARVVAFGELGIKQFYQFHEIRVARIGAYQFDRR